MLNKILSDENLQLITGQIFVGQAILVAYKLGLFKLLVEKPYSIAEISIELQLTSRATQSLISSAAALKLVDLENENYKLTNLGVNYFDPKSTAYYGDVLDLLIQQNEIMDLNSVEKSILTDKAQVDSGVDIFSDKDGLGNTGKFVAAIHYKAHNPAFSWSRSYSLEDQEIFVDIGGGSGIHSIAACFNNPKLKAIVCDREAVLSHTKKYIEENSLTNRIEVKAIDMWHDKFPVGDVFFLGDIFHDWDEKKCLYLAKKCYKSIPDKGKIILHEMLFNEAKTGPFLTAAYNMKMMMWTEGKQYTFSELKTILEEAGFVNVATQKTLGNWSIVIGEKP